ncbi:MAG: AAA family ATPase [Paludibacteraceae bacterium]|nr:AAA family ATPase [Paludibacteraceae bacterium]
MGIARELKKQITDRLKPQKVMLIYGADTVRMIADKSISNYKRLFDGLELLAIDEAQHIPEIGMKLKLMVDEIPGLSIIATGSSSFDLQNQAGEPLVGRCTR